MEPHLTPPAWTLLMPLKPLSRAKSRLAAAAAAPARARLALAFAQDAVSAALTCTAVHDVAVVTNDEQAAEELAALGAHIVPDAPDAGLNPALAHGAAVVRGIRPEAPLAALNADLPALRARELARVLQAAAEAPRAFLADAAGTGTTLLSAMPGHALRPRFGPRSRAGHAASGASELLLADADSVRQDVDTEADLAAAVVLGVGPHTAGALCGGPGPTPVNAV
ncbi:2-phospho-L-lactate guanylyltransferase [Streptomyces daqingensis]|uniref:Phosphoenolpyruvate guanylyltransferase n=1 Tax=Streptomyces daqingensis TaxID=1472640 RepID=A0ABQ2M7I3_9ACTN|nr:2-phospho-L-lactate guanylyltransferase [Streptomyces daqingensis]GGO48149.1 2-phospho-L-lactate guanylyltransferase [Streptomyces daqingensis]